MFFPPDLLQQEWQRWFWDAPFAASAPGRVNGPAAVRATVEWLLAQFPDLQMTIEAMVAQGDLVAVRILSEGTNLGAFNGVLPPTGKHFVARQSHWFRIADNQLAGPSS